MNRNDGLLQQKRFLGKSMKRILIVLYCTMFSSAAIAEDAFIDLKQCKIIGNAGIPISYFIPKARNTRDLRDADIEKIVGVLTLEAGEPQKKLGPPYEWSFGDDKMISVSIGYTSRGGDDVHYSSTSFAWGQGMKNPSLGKNIDLSYFEAVFSDKIIERKVGNCSSRPCTTFRYYLCGDVLASAIFYNDGEQESFSGVTSIVLPRKNENASENRNSDPARSHSRASCSKNLKLTFDMAAGLDLNARLSVNGPSSVNIYADGSYAGITARGSNCVNGEYSFNYAVEYSDLMDGRVPYNYRGSFNVGPNTQFCYITLSRFGGDPSIICN